MTPDQFAAARGRPVSRETFDRLQILADLLSRWNPKINLVSKSTLADLWRRHFLDSTQVFDIARSARGHWDDIGSGGGFPGLVVAILAAVEAPDLTVRLIESDQRKAAFLATALRETGVSAAIWAGRAELAAPLNADMFSARAVAPLTDLLAHATRLLCPSGRALLPKGANHQAEIDAALATWRFRLQKHPSTTQPGAVVLEIEGISRA